MVGDYEKFRKADNWKWEKQITSHSIEFFFANCFYNVESWLFCYTVPKFLLNSQCEERISKYVFPVTFFR